MASVFLCLYLDKSRLFYMYSQFLPPKFPRGKILVNILKKLASLCRSKRNLGLGMGSRARNSMKSLRNDSRGVYGDLGHILVAKCTCAIMREID